MSETHFGLLLTVGLDDELPGLYGLLFQRLKCFTVNLMGMILVVVAIFIICQVTDHEAAFTALMNIEPLLDGEVRPGHQEILASHIQTPLYVSAHVNAFAPLHWGIVTFRQNPDHLGIRLLTSRRLSVRQDHHRLVPTLIYYRHDRIEARTTPALEFKLAFSPVERPGHIRDPAIALHHVYRNKVRHLVDRSKELGKHV